MGEALVCIFMVVCVVAVCFLVALLFLPFLLIANVLKGNTCEQKFWIAAIGVLINCVKIDRSVVRSASKCSRALHRKKIPPKPVGNHSNVSCHLLSFELKTIFMTGRP